MSKNKCPYCKRGSRYSWKRREGKFYCEFCGKFSIEPLDEGKVSGEVEKS